ncbi:larval cuticle protein 9-like [Teleopsis dalmanni]|uniref:larval cuticle protein 9-like n=1 Tax=Teleopsis dalmanni TaxID=139649 RepID=UPI0018CD1583|nr:larval cuticle protein 9-like [Teleopsis dalmanni]
MILIRIFIILLFVIYAVADVKHISDRNLDLFKYDPSDIYTLPEDIDDDKPAIIFGGDVMKAAVEKLQNLNGNKKFKLDLKTQNGIEVTSVGKLKDEKTFIVSGAYSFTGADGKRYKTRYTADEFGYHPITELDLDIPK